MLLFVRILCLLAVLADVLAYDSSFVQLIDDAVTILFPPVRVSAYLCRLDQDETIRLSRVMSRSGLAHEIRAELEGLEVRTDRDLWDHRVLYVLDLDCDYAVPLLRAANASGMFSAPTRWLLLRDGTIGENVTDDENVTVEQTFRDMAVYPDSEVTVATEVRPEVEDGSIAWQMTSVYRPSPFRELLTENRGTWTADRGVRAIDLRPTSRRRRDLRRTTLKSCLVMTDPDTINHLTDYENKHIDPVTKANYPWVMHIANRMNATIEFRVTDSWGYRDKNGTWNGMTGMLQRREIDIGGTATFFIPQRIGVVDYIQLYTRTNAHFIFRQPLLSSISNIFVLPFQRSVWIAIGVFLLLVLALLSVSAKWEYRRGMSANNAEYWQQFHQSELTLGDSFMVVLGAIAQQGYSYEPYRVPPRIVTLMLLIAALNLYASYTANIVALLQSTTDSIKTPADLLHSPLKLGVQDVVYSRHYFKTFQDPVRRALVDQKIEPKGHNGSWMTVQEGVRRVRNGLFAFHAELGAFYKIVQETYLEEEKCGIMEIDVLNMLYPLLVMQTRSPYLEIVKNAALVVSETGLQTREDSRLYTKKPKCHGSTSFVRIGITECYFALVAVGYGTLLSLVVLAAEFLWCRVEGSIDRWLTNDDAVPRSQVDPFELVDQEIREFENGSA
ncbi:glutamate receptor 1-like [Frieseomelitta varia]|uniref:glutamate receptor 1-like n=1 Tax=Frieseomelitta varia TaxID=561572 RepID=UPI001CB67BB5|nr:glutamate receptor 1-like [Frieseomelitta varia]